MYQGSLFPLRTAVGQAIPIGKKSKIGMISQSHGSRDLSMAYDWDVKGSINDTIDDPRYADYLPLINIGGVQYTPGSGMAILPPPPSPPPFPEDEQVISFFALTDASAVSDVSRKLSARFLIQLPEEYLVGGICFGGFPYLPYSSQEMGNLGVNSSNFGLPREVRLVCSGATSADEVESGSVFEFLDSEASATKQEITSHSGFHFLSIDPTLTQYLTVHFSDFPRIVREVGISLFGPRTLEEFYGFIIPYFYVYTYEEKTRYRPQVSAGLLGVKRIVPGRPTGPFTIPTDMTAEERLNSGSSGLNNDYRNIVQMGDDEGRYYDFTAASIFGQQRIYRERTKVALDLNECFISSPVAGGGKIVLYIQQAEDYERCIAGLKMLMPFVPKTGLSDESMQNILEAVYGLFGNLDPDDELPPREELETLVRLFLRIPEETDFCEKIRIRVFEIDPPEGVSPVSVPPDDKYATLLAVKEIDELSEIALAFFFEGIRFTRPSNCKYFAIEMTNYDNVAGQFVVKALRVVQSAHVSIHPRPARSQQVRTLNFRIIGADLAEDYALLGDEGFNFSIERFVAGERKSVLFRANSLLDLLHTGAAKIFSNVRRRAVEFEKSENYPAYDGDDVKYLVPGEFEMNGGPRFTPNYERRFTETKMDGWRRSRTGHGVHGKARWYEYNDRWGNKRTPGSFDNHSNAETGTHTELLSPQENVNEWKSNAFIGNAMYMMRQSGIHTIQTNFENDGDGFFLGENQIWIPTYDGVRLFEDFEDFWKGIIDENSSASIRKLKVKGIKSVTSSPFGINALTTEFFEFLDALRQTDPAVTVTEGLDFAGLVGAAYISQGRVFALSTANSLSVGLSAQPAGLGFTFSASTSGGLLTPSYTYVNSFGTQGSITRQASRTGYAYSQFRNSSFDEGDSFMEIGDGEMKRVVTRKEVPETDTQRIRGGEVMWQGELVDIISGAIPLNFTLPATATKMHFRTADDSLRVRLGSGVGKSVTVDFWFDITEEVVGDDY